jgi:hypothetical protein
MMMMIKETKMMMMMMMMNHQKLIYAILSIIAIATTINTHYLD